VETIFDRVAIINQGELKVEGRVADLTAEHEMNLEQLFLKIIGYRPTAEDGPGVAPLPAVSASRPSPLVPRS
jgi:ABC-type multidrug transport system ATPase subunit